jgi:hypothetical protein
MLETLVCQHCEQVIGYQEAEKTGTLYGVCDECQTAPQAKEERKEQVA